MAQDKHKEYIKVKLQSLLNELASEVLTSLPSDLPHFTLQWLESRSESSLSPPEQEELKNLRLELSKAAHGRSTDECSDDQSIEDSSDECPSPLMLPTKPKLRTSISAEAYGSWNKRSSFIPRVIHKSNDQYKRIKEVIHKCFMFSALNTQETEVLVLAFEERKFSKGDKVIQQGDDGFELFVVDSGELSCYKRFKADDDEKFLKNYGPGEAFGELALLYNVPRAASVVANGDCVCWVLDRDCFNNIVKDAAQKKRETYEQFLAGVELFKGIDAYERSQMADALQTVSFVDGEYVIREGDWGDVFYMVEEGEAVAMKTLKPGMPHEEVMSYSCGDYFGELALIKGAPRAASVVSKGPLKCAVMDRRAFKRLLGPLEDILKRNAAEYQGYNF